MASKRMLQTKLEIKTEQLENAYAAYTALLQGGVQSYSIGSRNLTKLSLKELEDTIEKLEKEVEIIQGELTGHKRRKAFGVIPRDI